MRPERGVKLTQEQVDDRIRFLCLFSKSLKLKLVNIGMFEVADGDLAFHVFLTPGLIWFSLPARGLKEGEHAGLPLTSVTLGGERSFWTSNLALDANALGDLIAQAISRKKIGIPFGKMPWPELSRVPR